MIKFLIFLSAIAYANSASVKREEYNPDSLLALANQVNANRDSNAASNNSPVYNPSGSSNVYPSYSASYGNQAISNQNANNAALNYAASQSEANQAYVDNVAAAASNIQSAQQNQQAYPNLNQGNLYYYYYPVQDKNKEITYQASPSNQYTSSIVQPQNSNDDQSNQNNAGNQQQQLANAQQQNPGHDLSYGGAQDLAYTASALNENSQNGAQQGGSYDNQQLSNLASTLSQYNFGAGSNGNAFSSQFANQLSGLNNLNNLGFGEAFSGSMAQPSSVPFVNDPAFSSAMASQLANFQQSSGSGSSGSSGGPLSQLYQQAANVYQGYQGLLNGQSASQQPQFAASQHSSSYEPSTGGSSFRSKYGLGSIMMPLIALAGLSLLIPSLSTVTSRKKRSIEDKLDIQQAGLGAYLERMDRYYSIYKNAIERGCFDRIICELGDAVSGVRGKDAFFDFVDRVMPNGWVGKGSNSKVSIFKTSALSRNDNSKCEKYKCN